MVKGAKPIMRQNLDTSVTLSGVRLDNPVLAASGTFGYGREFAELYDINLLGSFSFKGTTREPRFGNPTPRVAECEAGMLNAVGLQNPGIDAVLAEELPALAKVFHKPVMANISGFSVGEYVECCRKIDAAEQVGWIEAVSYTHLMACIGGCPTEAIEYTSKTKGRHRHHMMQDALCWGNGDAGL